MVADRPAEPQEAIVAFLRARLDVDEQIARDADGISKDALLGLYEDLIQSRPLDDQRRAYGIHISHFTSGRLLWDITAKRRIMQEHPVVEGGHPAGGRGRVCATCAGGTNDGDLEGDPYPCLTVRILALPYADHDDYHEGWRP